MTNRMDDYPDSIDGYKLTKQLLGHGAFAVVIRGQKQGVKGDEGTVAIKVIHKKALNKTAALIEKELNILKKLSELKHENLVSLLACKEIKNNVFFVMEYCNGGDLADYMQAKGKLCELVIRTFLNQIAAGVYAIHEKAIVHRDLKPQNILLCLPSTSRVSYLMPASDIRLKIADFGFARFLESGNMAGTMCGSPMYMAPEVIMSLQYDAKADLWSVGTIVYQCLTGAAPFEAKSPAALKKFYLENKNVSPKIPPTASPEIADLIRRLLCKDPRNRIGFKDLFDHPFLNGSKIRATKNQPIVICQPKPIPSRIPIRRKESAEGNELHSTIISRNQMANTFVNSLSTNELSQRSTKSTMTDFVNLAIPQSANTSLTTTDDKHEEIPVLWSEPVSQSTTIVDKLEFVVRLVEYICRIVPRRLYEMSLLQISSPGGGEAILEELVLNQAALRTINSTMDLVAKSRLFDPCSRSLALVRKLNDLSVQLVRKSKMLIERYTKTSSDEQSSSVDGPNQLIYSHAIKLCAEAVADERLGRNSKEVVVRLIECQVLFHYLSQLANGPQRKQLVKMREAVEAKLGDLQKLGIMSIVP